MKAADDGSLHKVGITAAGHKPRALEYVGLLSRELAARDIDVLVDDRLEGCGDECGRPVPIAQCAQTDLLVVLGGDGSLLSAARLAAPLGTPLMGVDLGSFGFLAAEDPQTLLRHLDELLAGHYTIENRVMLTAALHDGDDLRWRTSALNDIVISRACPGRLVRMRTCIDDAHVATYPSDGLIVATATGSTAYNLSAGGPIVDPRMQSLLLTPICPHTLYSRPLLVPAEVRIAITIEGSQEMPQDVTLVADGQEAHAAQVGWRIDISRAPYDARLVRLTVDGLFYERLRDKLRWGAER